MGLSRRFLSSAFLALMGVFSLSASALDFVVDLDSTLIFLPPREGDSVIEANGKNYGVAPGAGAFIQSLKKIPEARVSFFTAYPIVLRNNEALRKILLPDGSSAREAAFKVLHGSRAMRSSKEPDPIALQPLFSLFWGNIKKDLQLVSSDLDLENTILIDDTHTNALRDQEKSLLWIHNHSEDGELARARGLIEESLHQSEKQGLSTTEALWQLQWNIEDPSELRYKNERANNSKLYSSGEKLLQDEDSEFKISAETLKLIKKSSTLGKEPQGEASFLKKFAHP